MHAKLIFIVWGLFLTTVRAGMATPGTGSWWFTGATRAILATAPHALDALDTYDVPAFASPHGWMAGTYKVSGQDGWDGDTGFWGFDYRAPLLPGQAKTWMLYIWIPPGGVVDDSQFNWGSQIEDPDVTPRLEYVQRPEGVTGGPALGTVWTLPPYRLSLPVYGGSDGPGGYGFRFTLTMIPEPSTLTFLSLGALAIAAARRKRR